MDEDQLHDGERRRTTEQVAYVIVGGSGFEPPEPSAAADPVLLGPAHYEIGSLGAGEPVYVDRGYAYTGMPHELKGLPVVRTANGDKRDDVDLRIQLAAPSTLYVGFDVRGSTLPSWLLTWEAMPDALIRTTDTDFRIYRKRFPAGEASLGGTGLGKGSYSMYVVAIE